MSDINALIDDAKLKIFANSASVFIRSILFKMEWHVIEEDMYNTIPTAATDGVNLYLNPNYLEQVGCPDKIAGLFLHEAWHTALEHTNQARRGGRDKTAWNVAGDYVINLMIKDDGFDLPEGGLYDTQFRNMSTEDVYDHIMDNAQNFEKELSAEAGYDTHVIEPETAEEAAAIEQQVKQNIIAAALEAELAGDKAYGKIPGELRKRIYDLRNPKVDWRTALRRYTSTVKKNDYSFSKFNKKYMPIYIPALHSEDVSVIAMALDVSGSITKEDANNFMSEIHSIMKRVKPKEIIVYIFNHGLVKVERVKKVSDIENISFRSSGGTDINPVLEHIKDNHIKPKVLLIFSDMYFPMVEEKINFPTIWVAFDNPDFESEQGKTIHYDSSQQ